MISAKNPIRFSGGSVKAIQKCPECGTTTLSIDRDKGEISCKECGLVLDDRMISIDKPFKIEDGLIKADGIGPALSYRFPDKGVFTKIRDFDLKKLPAKQRYAFKRYKKWQWRMRTTLERHLDIALNFIKIYTSKLHLSDIIEEEACRLYTLLAQTGTTRGRAIEYTASAAVYVAGRIHGSPISLKALEEIADIPKREIGRTMRIMVRTLGIRLAPQNPIDYIAKICAQLDFSPRVQTRAVRFTEKALKRKNLSGKGPFGLAAAAVYLSSLMMGEKKTQKEIADVATVTEVTIRNRFQELVEILEMDIRKYKYKKKKFK